jgi:hypothetical protein
MNSMRYAQDESDENKFKLHVIDRISSTIKSQVILLPTVKLTNYLIVLVKLNLDGQ